MAFFGKFSQKRHLSEVRNSAASGLVRTTLYGGNFPPYKAKMARFSKILNDLSLGVSVVGSRHMVAGPQPVNP